ncbi:MAG: hydantoinase/oxoprolinase family protein [Chloroflexi bacterium]|nr:hydantoinase/oxoprolinase family protein [Chloroflexota bacterium]
MRRIGIDVGGTNTDAVLVEDERVVAGVKTPTTDDVTGGILHALRDLLAGLEAGPGHIDAVMIGTTHFTNAVVQRRGLKPVAAVRIGLPASASLPPFVDWPDDLAAIARGRVFMIEGGHEYDGRPLVEFDAEAMRSAAREIAASGITSVGIASIFSPLTAECEEAAAGIVREECPGVDITLSHDLGRIGLLERENATLLNACIIDLARRTMRAFTDALRQSGIDAPLYLTQNDGTVMRAEFAEEFPIYSFASGPTNSMRGAAFLTGLQDAVVIDVGGTTTDVGVLRAGFPREANNVVEIGGVRTLFRMPDLLSIGLGGGSLVDPHGMSVGPLSVGHRITDESRVFGGSTLTATDIAVAAGLVELGDNYAIASLDPALVEACRERIRAMIDEAVDRMKVDATPVPLIAVGGAAFLVPDDLPGVSEVIQVQHRGVANAVGAAIAQVSGEVDQVFSDVGRAAAIDAATQLAKRRAIDAGADPATLAVVEVEDLPLSYVPGDALRVRVRVVGDTAAK